MTTPDRTYDHAGSGPWDNRPDTPSGIRPGERVVWPPTKRRRGKVLNFLMGIRPVKKPRQSPRPPKPKNTGQSGTKPPKFGKGILRSKLPALDSVGLSPEPAFTPFAAPPANGFSRDLDADITAYQRRDVAELHHWIAVDTTQPNPLVKGSFAKHVERDAGGKEVEATTLKHPKTYKPAHAVRDEPTVDLADAITTFVATWHRGAPLQAYAEKRVAPLFGGAA